MTMEPQVFTGGVVFACLEPPAPEYDVHDQIEQYEGQTGVVMGAGFEKYINQPWPEPANTYVPAIQVFEEMDYESGDNEDLGKNFHDFLSPYDRYRHYRTLAQFEELKEFQEKEAKIAAISKGNELIKTEVLLKVQEAKAQVENEIPLKESVPNEPSTSAAAAPPPPCAAKLMGANIKGKAPTIDVTANPNRAANPVPKLNFKSNVYRNKTYKKFRETHRKHKG